jgi:hypothetical protein
MGVLVLIVATSSLLEQDEDCNVVKKITITRANRRLMLFVFAASIIVVILLV